MAKMYFQFIFALLNVDGVTNTHDSMIGDLWHRVEYAPKLKINLTFNSFLRAGLLIKNETH